MASEGREHGDASLEELRQRWEEEGSQRVLLELVEEYRGLGRLQEAEEVLEEGVERHREHLAARVALGRVRLDLGKPRGAARALESVLSQDPTQLVANKLLVRAYVELGEPDRARNRLDFYSLLNESDPEIELLSAEVDEAAGRGPEAEVAPPPEGEEGEAEVPAEPVPGAADSRLAGGETGGETTFDEGLSVDEDLAFDEGVAVDEGERIELPPPAEPSRPAASRASTPWPELEADGREAIVWRGLRAGGVLPFAAAPPAGEPAAPPAAPSEEEAGASRVTTDAVEPPIGAPPEEEQPWGGAAEPEPEVAEEEAERPTVTLGDLYLAQGHLREARDQFAGVLERRPDDAAARRGLAAVEERLHRPPTAAELLGPEGVALPAAERRRRVLAAWLERLKSGAS